MMTHHSFPYCIQNQVNFGSFPHLRTHILQKSDGTPMVPHTANPTPKQIWQLHMYWDFLTSWIHLGFLPCDKSIALELYPVCATCQFGKYHRWSHRAAMGHIDNSHSGSGNSFSSDGMEAGYPGRPLSILGHVEEILKSKQEFDIFSGHHGVNIKIIRADNGVYTTKIFQEYCFQKWQWLNFFADAAHWQNSSSLNPLWNELTPICCTAACNAKMARSDSGRYVALSNTSCGELT